MLSNIIRNPTWISQFGYICFHFAPQLMKMNLIHILVFVSKHLFVILHVSWSTSCFLSLSYSSSPAHIHLTLLHHSSHFLPPLPLLYTFITSSLTCRPSLPLFLIILRCFFLPPLATFLPLHCFKFISSPLQAASFFSSFSSFHPV